MNTFTPYSVTAGVLQLTLVSVSDGSTRRHNHFHCSSIITSYLPYYDSYVKPNRRTVPLSRNHCCCWKAINITYSECVSVSLLIQPAKRMQHIFICSLTVPYFVTLPYKRRDFREKYTEHEICVVISSTKFVWSTSHCKKNSVKIFHKCVMVFM